MSRRRDHRTLDLLSWRAPEVAPSFRPEQVRAATLRTSLCRAIALALKESGKDRDAVADEIGAYLGEPVSKNMLDAYVSEARDDHIINVIRFWGLLHAVRDIRLLQMIAQPLGWAVIPERYLGAVEEAMLAAEEEDIVQRRRQARRKWRGVSP